MPVTFLTLLYLLQTVKSTTGLALSDNNIVTYQKNSTWWAKISDRGDRAYHFTYLHATVE